MKGVAIVGSGLFGSIAAALAHRKGFAVTIIDRGEPLAGSGPAACLMKPGWFSGLSNQEVDDAFGLLGALYEVKTLSFKVNKLASTPVYWVNPRSILGAPAVTGAYRVKGDVQKIHEQHLDVCRPDGSEYQVGFDYCLVATGVWASQLVPGLPLMKALAGAAFTFDAPCPQPFIDVWAPYKQLVGFEREPGKTWVGDGSAILEKNWTNNRRLESFGRCRNAIEQPDAPVTAITGLRPYVDGHKAGYFAKAGPRTWISTGGAKNGTIIAALQAKKFLDAITQ